MEIDEGEEEDEESEDEDEEAEAEEGSTFILHRFLPSCLTS